MSKVVKSTGGGDDLSNGLHQSRETKQEEVTDNKIVTRKFYDQFTLRDICGFAELQTKVTYGLRNILSLTGSKKNAVSNRASGIPKSSMRKL